MTRRSLRLLRPFACNFGQTAGPHPPAPRRISSAHRPQRPAHRRSAVATIWLLGMIPLAIMTVTFALDIGWLNLARTDLQMAVDSAALAATRVWGVSPANSSAVRTSAKQAAHTLLLESTLVGNSAPLGTVSLNNDPTALNNNLVCNGHIQLGSVSSNTFSAGTEPPDQESRGCHVDLQVTVTSPFGFGQRTLRARATADWNASANEARLINATIDSCP